jgi:DNA-binding transcriptional MerR regulator
MGSPKTHSIQLPDSVVRELEEVEALDFSVGLDELVEWVNGVVAHYAPEAEQGGSGRVSPAFTARSFRHYQTLGCIDPPQKDGRMARYGFRHYLQALLIRKLLWDRVPAERIRDLLDARSTAEYKELLFRGVRLVARSPAGTGADEMPPAAAWTRVPIVPGVELHLREHTSRPKPAELKQWMQAIEQAIRKTLR